LKSALGALGIGADVHYPVADYRQPAVEAAIGVSAGLPETDRAVSQILTIPCFPELTDNEADTVIAAIRGFFGA
jgi:dTDP-4-amino-4,6-dideoxygalactose transaminase